MLENGQPLLCVLYKRNATNLDPSSLPSLCVAMISIIVHFSDRRAPASRSIAFAHCRLTADSTRELRTVSPPTTEIGSLNNVLACHELRNTTPTCSASKGECCPLRLSGSGIRRSGSYVGPACLLSTTSNAIKKYSAVCYIYRRVKAASYLATVFRGGYERP